MPAVMVSISSAFLFAATTPGLASIFDYITIDGQYVSYLEGTVALRTGHAVLIGGLLVGSPTASYSVPYYQS